MTHDHATDDQLLDTPPPARRSVVTDRWFLLVCLATLGFWMGVFSHVPLVPLYLRDIGSGATVIGLVYGAGALGALLGRIGVGWALDRVGERPFFALGSGIWLVTAVWTPATREPALVAAIWVIKGIGLGVFTTATVSWIARYVPADQRGLAMGWWGAANPIAAVAAPTAAVFVQHSAGFTTAFALTMVPSAFACLAIAAPGTVRAGAPRPRRSTRTELFIEPGAIEPGIMGFLVAVTSSGFLVFVPLLAAETGGANPGVYLSVYAAASVLSRFVAGSASDRWGRIVVIAPSLATAALGVSLLVAVADTTGGLIGAGLFGLGIGGAMPSLMAWTTDRAAPERRGLAVSTYYSLYEVGLFAGAAVMGPAVARLGSLAFPVLGLTLAAGTAVHVLRHWPRPMKKASRS